MPFHTVPGSLVSSVTKLSKVPPLTSIADSGFATGSENVKVTVAESPLLSDCASISMVPSGGVASISTDLVRAKMPGRSTRETSLPELTDNSEPEVSCKPLTSKSALLAEASAATV